MILALAERSAADVFRLHCPQPRKPPPEIAITVQSSTVTVILVYSALVALDETQMQIEDKLVNLAPGMAVTVEIKTGRRRIIECLMSPLLRYRQESLRER